MGGLIRKTIIGFVQLLLLLGAFLFLSAGSMDYWQAWLYLAVFFGCTALVTVSLIRHDRKLLQSRLHVGVVAEKEPRQKIIQAFASLFFVGLFVAAGLDVRFGLSRVPTVAVVLADLVVALGFLIIHLVFRESSFASAIIEVSEAQQVVSTGPYGIVRHPMYAGALLMLLATPIALGSTWALLAFLPLCLTIIARLLDEERVLCAQLPGYQAYCEKIRYRLVPRLW